MKLRLAFIVVGLVALTVEAVAQSPSRLAFDVASIKPAVMRDLASEVSAFLDRPVIDKTGIEAAYTYSLQWAPESGPNLNDLPGF